MGLHVIMVTGPRRAGKSALISCLLKEVCTSEPHYIRLAAVQGTKRAPRKGGRPAGGCGVVTATWVNYDPARVFETLPDALTAIHRRDRRGCVVIEADADPNLRHAYPYDCRIFVMPAPNEVHDVFRTPQQAREVLQSVLHDTALFAGEIFGLAADDGSVDEAHEPHPDMSDSQIVQLMRTPLGRELNSRIQCQPEYHDIVESDVVVMNTGVGGTSSAADDVVCRLEKLIQQARPGGNRRPEVFCCDITDPQDPRRQKLFGHLDTLYAGRSLPSG